MRRRDFIAGLGGAAAAPLAARAQQAIPVVGFLGGANPETNAHLVTAFKQGLEQVGFVEGRNVAIEYRWALGRPNLLPALAAELVERRVSLIAANPTVAALAAKATASIPIVFITSDNPISLGLVESFNRPGGNATGVNFLLNELGTKRLELLRELVPTATKIGLLLNPNSPPAAAALPEIEAICRSLGLETQVQHARSEQDIEVAYATFAEWKASAGIVFPDGSVFSARAKLAEQAARHSIPTIYPLREFVAAGGLLSYGSSAPDAFRLMGNLSGRILKGEKPAELPVIQSTKFELVVNLKAARAIRLTIPEAFLTRADEVIE